MTDADKQYFEEFLFKAVQSGKKETSDLVADILHKIDPVIKEGIEVHVNGKIKNLTKMVGDHNIMVDAYIKEDTAWKERAEPVVKAFENTTWLGALLIKILKILGLLGVALGAYLAIKNFLQ